MGKKSRAQVNRMNRRAEARGEIYTPPMQEVCTKLEDPKDDIHNKKTMAARNLVKALKLIESSSELKSKERRSQKRKAEAIAAEESNCTAEELLEWYQSNVDVGSSPEESNDRIEDEKPKKKPKLNANPYIVFVGQLSFDTSKEDLFHHIKKELGKEHSVTNENIKIRLLTDEKSKKSRGMAFIETTDPEMMYSFLKLHQTFLKGRRINVERSAGGKKNSSSRKAKIKQFREDQEKYISDAVEKMLAEFIDRGEITERELDEGAIGLCKRHSAATVESALTRYLETNGRDMDNSSAYFMSLIGKIATEGVHDGSKWGNKNDGNKKKSQSEQTERQKHSHSKISNFAKAGINMRISDKKEQDFTKIFPSMTRGRGRGGRGYM
mmetsp:Transcript_13845/g.20425  ORF Transcript_13845/g.20425 Transcript_13845/m.20425 type:complete len:381 (+) Transcript_13845:130-1272(+)|eukprot:CAMPEP_0194217154 /NCGR_PEP_ID=MMETSP0156-20130528/20470_1 /TAXON_ID=33649 /ORGANISM="Thalassionema nitzschioides, Strain L26-B" /LENGTH=380 /DNA_ID=CAMNT_0038946113 /DNA_START=42 /DNA_END=1184 /DNA_ORIENTATION=+